MAFDVASTRHSISMANGIPTVKTMRSNSVPSFLRLRGGEDVSIEETNSEVIEPPESALEDDAILFEEENLVDTTMTTESQETTLEAKTPEISSASGKATLISYAITAIKCAGASYSGALITHPIITKALTAGLTFGLSDWTAQRIESKSSASDNKKTRIETTIKINIRATTSSKLEEDNFFYGGGTFLLWTGGSLLV